MVYDPVKGRERITARITANREKAAMELAQKQSVKEEFIPVFKRRENMGGMNQKDLNRFIDKSHTSQEFKRYAKAKNEKSFVVRPGTSKVRRMDEKGFHGYIEDILKDPLNSNTRRHVETLKKEFKRF